MDYTIDELKAYIGKSQFDLPTPSVVLKESVLKRNCTKVLENVEVLGLSFRAHVKTLKTLECTKLMLGGVHKKVVVSTLREIRGLKPMVDDGSIDEILYGIPVAPSAIAELSRHAKSVKILLMIDHESQIAAIEAFMAKEGSQTPWGVFVKVDEGTHRAGLELNSQSLQKVIEQVELSPLTTLHGFYVHAGRSYNCCSDDEASSLLNGEISAVADAASLHAKIAGDRPLILSFGATPTVHAINSIKLDSISKNCTLELHGGCYPANDLQQLSTRSISEDDLAVKVVAEVCSIYPDRNEALINAGVLALSRETSHAFPGFGNVVGQKWIVGRLSQEHGILMAPVRDTSAKVEDYFKVGQKVLLNTQHVCITVSGYGWYFVVDDEGVVADIWYPWRGW